MSSSQPDPHDPVLPAGPNPVAVALRAALKPFASLRLTVVLLALGVGLVFFGTLAQKTAGLWSVVDRYFWSWVVMIDLQPTLEFLKIFFGLSPTATAPSGLHIPFPGGKLIGGLMFLNLIAAHATRFRLTWKRAGIWMAHGGLLLLFVGEFITREFQVEQRMTIPQGEAVNFSEDSRLIELAFTSPDADGTFRMTVVSGSRLAKAARTHEMITHPDLPVDIGVDAYMANSNLHYPEQDGVRKTDGKPIPDNRATAGLGLDAVAQAIPEVSGVGEDSIDLPSAYVTLFRKGTDEKIGTYLVSLWYTQNPFRRDTQPKQSVKVDGTAYDLALRYTRHYKPFSLYLREFRFDRYTGTQQAKNFSSDLTLVDPERGQEREVRVSMNDPLFYRGETYYQSNFDKTTEKTTLLQVVRNPGWLLPYLACGMVGVGLLFHFILGLGQYLKRQSANTRAMSDGELWALMFAGCTVGALLVRFGLLSHWLDSVLGPVGSGMNLFAELAAFLLVAAALPATGLYMLVARARGPRAAAPAPAPGSESTVFERLLPWGIVGLAVLMLVGAAMPRANPGSMDVKGAGRLPVVDGGRVKPLDTVARVYLRKISAREEFVAADGRMHPAIEWLLDAMASPNANGPAFKHKVIRIENAQVLSLLGLERREGYRYSLQEIAPKIGDLQKAMDKARPREGMPKPQADARIDKLFESGDRDVFAAQVMETAERVELYVKLCNRTIPLIIPPAGGKDWQSLPDAQELAQRDALLSALKDRGLLPKDLANLSEEETQKLDAEVRQRMFAALETLPGAIQLIDMIIAYRSEDSAKFGTALSAFRDATAPGVSQTDRAKVQFEVFLNEFAPAYQVIMLYVLAGALAFAGWVALSFRPQLGHAFQKASFWLLVSTFVLHAFGLFARMYLMDRPLVFITNLYSTAVFIGWAAVGMGLFVERILPIGLGNAVASVVGGATAILAHNLATSGDTLEMMVAVLDTNFWLATHVTTINLGYAATYVAGVMGVIYIVVGVFTPALGKPGSVPLPIGVGTLVARGPNLGRVLGQVMYGVVCLATLLSFVGTVLGGIWADYSWGRFWGWDPKENGAVLIVLWNALILHARWCGLVKDRGVAVLTLGGNIITTWSYFGTNQLGVGLHNYGFNNALATGCMITWVAHFILVGVGLIPLKYWRSTIAAEAAAQQAAANAAGPAPRFQEVNPGHKYAKADAPHATGQPANGAEPKHPGGKGKKPDRRR